MTSPTLHDLHPVILEAARGELPDWAVASAGRRSHMASVATLMGAWARELDLGSADRTRWLAAAWLHDALRDADPDELADIAPDVPPPLRHGPAAAERLQAAGVSDPELLDAVRYHTLGHPELGLMGRFLYLADYLEPLRPFEPARRAALRARLPEHHGQVLRWVCRRRLGRLLARDVPLRAETVGFWNRLVREM